MNEEQKKAGVACVRAQIAVIQADRVRASREDRESKDAYLAACDDLHAGQLPRQARGCQVTDSQRGEQGMSETRHRSAAWSDEDGNYWAEGHISPSRVAVLCREHDDDCGIDSVEEGVDDGGLSPSTIRHSWWRPVAQVGGDDDEDAIQVRCGPDHPGALPYTEWRR